MQGFLTGCVWHFGKEGKEENSTANQNWDTKILDFKQVAKLGKI